MIRLKYEKNERFLQVFSIRIESQARLLAYVSRAAAAALYFPDAPPGSVGCTFWGGFVVHGLSQTEVINVTFSSQAGHMILDALLSGYSSISLRAV